MPRIITVGAAQLGPIARADSRAQVVERLLALLHAAKANGCDVVVRDAAGPTPAGAACWA